MRTRAHGYTLMEMVVVLFIVAILSLAVGQYAFQPRQKPAVQAILGELEGLIAESHKYSSATLGTVRLNMNGTWAARTLQLDYQSLPPVGAPGPVVNSFRAAAFKDWTFAGVDDQDQIGAAVGAETLAASLTAMSPDIQAELATALGNPLIGKSVQINPFNKQFLTPFCIPVVGLRNGATYAGAPVGMVVVTGNRIYKFYKAGTGADNPWRRM